MRDSGCGATRVVAGFGTVRCSLAAHGTDTFHRWQSAAEGVGFAVMWGDSHRRIGFAEINGLSTVLTGLATANDEEIATALFGWLSDRPGVSVRLRAMLGSQS